MSKLLREGLVFAIILISSCSGSNHQGVPSGSNASGPLTDPNTTYIEPIIPTAQAGHELLNSDTKPGSINSDLGKGSHKALLDEAYDLEMQREFDTPPKIQDDYAVETVEVSAFTHPHQHYVRMNVQTNETTIESTAPAPPKQLVVGPAPLGFLIGASRNLQANAIIRYEFETIQKTSSLKTLHPVLDFFAIDTANNSFQEGQNRSELTSKNFFDVLLHDATPKVQFKIGARQVGEKIIVYIRIPTGNPTQLTVFRFTLTKESQLQFPVIYFPMTGQQWANRAHLLPQHPISDLSSFSFVDPLRSLEQKLVYVNLKGILELSTSQLPEDVRKRVLEEIQSRPELLFVLVAMTNTSQVMIGDLSCPTPLSCRQITQVAMLTQNSVLVLSRAYLSNGGTIEGILNELVYTDRSNLQPRYAACYGNNSALNFHAQLKELKLLKDNQSTILKSLSDNVSRALATSDSKSKQPKSGRAVRESIRKKEIKRYLASIDKDIQKIEKSIRNINTHMFLKAGRAGLTQLGQVQPLAQDFDAAIDIGSTVTQGSDPCTHSLAPDFDRMRRVEAERIRMITKNTELPEYFFARVDYAQFAYQLDLIPTTDLPLIDIHHKDHILGKMSPLFSPDRLGGMPYNGLRVAFAIQNKGTTFVEDDKGKSREVPRLSFVQQRINDLRNVVYAYRTLVFVLENTASFAKALEWLSQTYPNLKLAELIFDTHGQEGTIALGEVSEGAKWLSGTNASVLIKSLQEHPKTDPFNIFINACLVALDGGIFARSLNSYLAKGVHSTVLSADENYKVSVRQVHNFESQPGSSFTFQYTHGRLFVHEKESNPKEAVDLVYVKKPIRFYSGQRDTASPTREIQTLPVLNLDRILLRR